MPSRRPPTKTSSGQRYPTARRGARWLADFDETKNPWFYFSYGNGLYHHHRSWIDDTRAAHRCHRRIHPTARGRRRHLPPVTPRFAPSATGSPPSTARCSPRTCARSSTSAWRSPARSSRSSRTTTSTSSTGYFTLFWNKVARVRCAAGRARVPGGAGGRLLPATRRGARGARGAPAELELGRRRGPSRPTLLAADRRAAQSRSTGRCASGYRLRLSAGFPRRSPIRDDHALGDHRRARPGVALALDGARGLTLTGARGLAGRRRGPSAGRPPPRAARRAPAGRDPRRTLDVAELDAGLRQDRRRRARLRRRSCATRRSSPASTGFPAVIGTGSAHEADQDRRSVARRRQCRRRRDSRRAHLRLVVRPFAVHNAVGHGAKPLSSGGRRSSARSRRSFTRSIMVRRRSSSRARPDRQDDPLGDGRRGGRERSRPCSDLPRSRGRSSLSFAGLSELLAPVLEEAAPSLVAPATAGAGGRAAARRARRRSPPDAHAIGLAVLDVLRVLAERGPVVVALDDVQWLDSASAGVAPDRAPAPARRARRTPGDAADGRRTSQPVRARPVLPRGRLEQLSLGPLSLGRCTTCSRSGSGWSSRRPELARVQEATGGNPFFALEFGRELVRTDTRPAPGQALRVPESLQELLGGRLARLPRRPRDVLLAGRRACPADGRAGRGSARRPERVARGARGGGRERAWSSSTTRASASRTRCSRRSATSRRRSGSAAPCIARWPKRSRTSRSALATWRSRPTAPTPWSPPSSRRPPSTQRAAARPPQRPSSASSPPS